MTYVFPPSLYQLRDYLRSVGADTMAFASARQAAFMAQQLLNTRVKFPPKGEDMTPALFLIQKAVTEKGMAAMTTPSRDQRSKAVTAAADQLLRDAKVPKDKIKGVRAPKSKPKTQHNDFRPEVFAEGVHIFCDGACEPNPGSGGWGVVVYKDGREIAALSGGVADTTNNVMELTGMLQAVQWVLTHFMKDQPVTIWCDSMYVVNGCNEWRHKWKRNGWSKKGPNSPKREDAEVKNLDLWKAIDEALNKCSALTVAWVKGHIGIDGNERADELSLIGRREALDAAGAADPTVDYLDVEYRQIMGMV
ncbi:ribonuclease H family protein [Rhizobium rhizogenes]|uniref:ribonuclease H family protein n=1 Tax=Rhizobium rhizogenes TaxID=359 RepID=UPI001F16A39A|nr:ribonuclease H [Rhizobium rhizogenes]